MLASPSRDDPWADRLLHRYDRLATDEADALRRYLTRIGTEVVRLAAVHPGDRVLDLGAGTGMVTFLAAPDAGEQGHVVALDQSPGCLAEVCRLAGGGVRAASGLGVSGRGALVTALCASLPELPVADATFDAVVVRSVLMFV
jgi:ubiquinone/menaquinone biosynthesis C-methylase UbiE